MVMFLGLSILHQPLLKTDRFLIERFPFSHRDLKARKIKAFKRKLKLPKIYPFFDRDYIRQIDTFYVTISEIAKVT